MSDVSPDQSIRQLVGVALVAFGLASKQRAPVVFEAEDGVAFVDELIARDGSPAEDFIANIVTRVADVLVSAQAPDHLVNDLSSLTILAVREQAVLPTLLQVCDLTQTAQKDRQDALIAAAALTSEIIRLSPDDALRDTREVVLWTTICALLGEPVGGTVPVETAQDDSAVQNPVPRTDENPGPNADPGRNAGQDSSPDANASPEPKAGTDPKADEDPEADASANLDNGAQPKGEPLAPPVTADAQRASSRTRKPKPDLHPALAQLAKPLATEITRTFRFATGLSLTPDTPSAIATLHLFSVTKNCADFRSSLSDITMALELEPAFAQEVLDQFDDGHLERCDRLLLQHETATVQQMADNFEFAATLSTHAIAFRNLRAILKELQCDYAGAARHLAAALRNTMRGDLRAEIEILRRQCAAWRRQACIRGDHTGFREALNAASEAVARAKRLEADDIVVEIDIEAAAILLARGRATDETRDLERAAAIARGAARSVSQADIDNAQGQSAVTPGLLLKAQLIEADAYREIGLRRADPEPVTKSSSCYETMLDQRQDQTAAPATHARYGQTLNLAHIARLTSDVAGLAIADGELADAIERTKTERRFSNKSGGLGQHGAIESWPTLLCDLASERALVLAVRARLSQDQKQIGAAGRRLEDVLQDEAIDLSPVGLALLRAEQSRIMAAQALQSANTELAEQAFSLQKKACDVLALHGHPVAAELAP